MVVAAEWVTTNIHSSDHMLCAEEHALDTTSGDGHLVLHIIQRPGISSITPVTLTVTHSAGNSTHPAGGSSDMRATIETHSRSGNRTHPADCSFHLNVALGIPFPPHRSPPRRTTLVSRNFYRGDYAGNLATIAFANQPAAFVLKQPPSMLFTIKSAPVITAWSTHRNPCIGRTTTLGLVLGTCSWVVSLPRIVDREGTSPLTISSHCLLNREGVTLTRIPLPSCLPSPLDVTGTGPPIIYVACLLPGIVEREGTATARNLHIATSLMRQIRGSHMNAAVLYHIIQRVDISGIAPATPTTTHSVGHSTYPTDASRLSTVASEPVITTWFTHRNPCIGRTTTLRQLLGTCSWVVSRPRIMDREGDHLTTMSSLCLLGIVDRVGYPPDMYPFTVSSSWNCRQYGS